MKKSFLIPCMILMIILSGAACEGSADSPFSPSPENPDDGTDRPSTGGNGCCLVLYCSRTGNTERLARHIRTVLGCDLLEVEPELPYAEDYTAMLERAREELAAVAEGVYPAVRTSVDDFSAYETVFAGYPIWYGSMAAPMQSFLHGHAAKLAGKRIVLFATSGSSGMSASVGEARALCSGSDLSGPEFLLTSATLAEQESRVAAWLRELGLERGAGDDPAASPRGVTITAGGRTIGATIEDNGAGRDFLSRLPLETTLDDYAGTEKIFYPSPELNTADSPRGCRPLSGDIAVYAPWGNVAIFYKDGNSHSDDLIRIGRIDGDGAEALNTSGSLRVRFERTR